MLNACHWSLRQVLLGDSIIAGGCTVGGEMEEGQGGTIRRACMSLTGLVCAETG